MPFDGDGLVDWSCLRWGNGLPTWLISFSVCQNGGTPGGCSTRLRQGRLAFARRWHGSLVSRGHDATPDRWLPPPPWLFERSGAGHRQRSGPLSGWRRHRRSGSFWQLAQVHWSQRGGFLGDRSLPADGVRQGLERVLRTRRDSLLAVQSRGRCRRVAGRVAEGSWYPAGPSWRLWHYSAMTVPQPIKRHLESICRLKAARCPGWTHTGLRS